MQQRTVSLFSRLKNSTFFFISKFGKATDVDNKNKIRYTDEKKQPIVSLTESKSKNKIKRGKRKSKKHNSTKSMYIISNNCASITNKKDSLDNLVNKFMPGVVILQETKCRRKNTINLQNYSFFVHLRKGNTGGGLLTAVHNNLNPICVSDGGEIEVIVVKTDVAEHLDCYLYIYSFYAEEAFYFDNISYGSINSHPLLLRNGNHHNI